MPSKRRAKKVEELQVIAAPWLTGVQAVVLADRVYVAPQATPELNARLARFALQRLRLCSARKRPADGPSSD